MSAPPKVIYYMQLESKRAATLSLGKNCAMKLPSERWMIREFSQLGFIGKMFKSLRLSLIKSSSSCSSRRSPSIGSSGVLCG